MIHAVPIQALDQVSCTWPSRRTRHVGRWKTSRCGRRQFSRVSAQEALRDLETLPYIQHVYDHLASHLYQKAVQAEHLAKYMVAIAGPPGSGKSTAAGQVNQRINQMSTKAHGRRWSVVVPMDGFHFTRRQLDGMQNPVEAYARRGAPWTFDAGAFVSAIRQIRTAGSGMFPSFDHKVGDPVEGDIEVELEHRVVLIEGNYVLLDEEPWRDIRDIVDEAWYMDCDVPVAMQRVLTRQVANGAAPDVARKRIETNDRPNALQVLSSRHRADVVLPHLPMGRNGVHL